MKLFVILSFLGCFVTAKAGLVIDCTITDTNNCKTVDKPCLAHFHIDAAFEVNDVVVMSYVQAEDTTEVSCKDNGCEAYTSDEFYYIVVDNDEQTSGDVRMGGTGFMAACEEACAATAVTDPFSGFCQRSGECAFIPNACSDTNPPVGTATFVKYVPTYALIITCGMDDDSDCGTVGKPCSISLHSTAGFGKGDTIVMTYTQEMSTGESSCKDNGCEAYTSDAVYYTVLDLDAAEGQAVMGENGFRSACTEACCNTAALSPFSGFCQVADGCTYIAGGCDDDLTGVSQPVGLVTLESYDPPSSDLTPIAIDCDIINDDDCGTAEKPCDISLHSAAEFAEGDVIIMTYSQVDTDPEASCSANDGAGCEAYTSAQVYYTVLDLDAPNLDQVVMGENGFRPACTEACAATADGAFSGYCQVAQGCTGVAAGCTDTSGAHPVGAVTFELYDPPAASTKVVIDCDMTDDNDCGAAGNPCSISLHSDAEFAKGETIVMTYTQEKTDGEASCDSTGATDKGCEAYTVNEVYYTVVDLDAPTAGEVVMGENGFRPACTEACCSNKAGDPFSGYCQLEASCAFVAGGCDDTTGASNPAGTATFVLYTPPEVPTAIVIDCTREDDNDCGTVEKPCGIFLHSGAGFDEGDVVVMTYTQEKVDNEASCDATGATDKGCEAYTVDEVYYTVVDIETVTTENEVKMGENGFRPACTEACALTAGGPFSGYCQKEGDCTGIATGCDDDTGAHPVGEATFKKHDPTDTTTLPPGATTPSAATTEALAPVCAAVAALAMFT